MFLPTEAHWGLRHSEMKGVPTECWGCRKHHLLRMGRSARCRRSFTGGFGCTRE